MFSGPWEILIICFIALLLFGKRLPSAMRSMGQSIVEFKKGINGVEDDQSSENTSDASATSPSNRA